MSLIPKLLLIDDNEEILISLKSYLSKRNFDVISASNGLDALKLLEVATHDFDLVITDLVMPNISGVAVTTIIKKKKQVFSVWFVSSGFHLRYCAGI